MIDTAAIRIKNTLRIRRVLADMNEHTAQTVSAATGLSIATCNGILRQLARDGEALSEARQTNEVGRKTWFYRLSPCYAGVLFVNTSRHDQAYKINCSIRYRFGEETFHTARITSETPVTAIPQCVREILPAHPEIAHVFIACLTPAEERAVAAALAELDMPHTIKMIGVLISRLDFVTSGIGISSFVIADDVTQLYIFHSLCGSVTGDRILTSAEFREALPGFIQLFAPGHFVIIGNEAMCEALRAEFPKARFDSVPDVEALLMNCMVKWMQGMYTGEIV